jgi:hypothetical protein
MKKNHEKGKNKKNRPQFCTHDRPSQLMEELPIGIEWEDGV